MDALQVEALPCEEPAPADNIVLGAWSGTYTCTNYGTYTYTDDGGFFLPLLLSLQILGFRKVSYQPKVPRVKAGLTEAGAS